MLLQIAAQMQRNLLPPNQPDFASVRKQENRLAALEQRALGWFICSPLKTGTTDHPVWEFNASLRGYRKL